MKSAERIENGSAEMAPGVVAWQSNGFVIASFDSKQALKLDVRTDKDGVKIIDGPVDSIRWDDIERLARIVRETLIKLKLYEGENLKLSASLEAMKDRWNPTIRLIDVGGSASEESLQKTRSVIPVVLGQMTSNRRNIRVIDQEIDDAEWNIVEAIATGALSANGGRALHAEVNVVVEGESIARLTGKLAPKPDCSDFKAIPVDLIGVFEGFHAGAEILYFHDGERGEVKIAFGRVQVDLLKITRFVQSKQRVRVRVHKTLNKSGAELLAFVSVELVQHEPNLLSLSPGETS